MVYPKYDFTDVNLNYSDVYGTVVSMLSDLNAQIGKCKTTKYQPILNLVNNQLAVIPNDLATSTERYQEDVKAAYLLLYPIL